MAEIRRLPGRTIQALFMAALYAISGAIIVPFVLFIIVMVLSIAATVFGHSNAAEAPLGTQLSQGFGFALFGIAALGGACVSALYAFFRSLEHTRDAA